MTYHSVLGVIYLQFTGFLGIFIAVDLVEVCHPNNCNIGLLAYSPLGGGTLSGKYIDSDSLSLQKARLNLFPGFMDRYKESAAKVNLY